MSALTAVTSPAMASGGHPATAPRPGRAHLSLVPHEPARSPLRLTRRGRLGLTMAVLVAVLALAVGMSGWLPAFGGPAPAQVVVQPGQTLSGLAMTYLPELATDQAIVEIQLLNGMNTTQVQAGQQLLMPRP